MILVKHITEVPPKQIVHPNNPYNVMMLGCSTNTLSIISTSMNGRQFRNNPFRFNSYSLSRQAPATHNVLALSPHPLPVTVGPLKLKFIKYMELTDGCPKLVF